VKANVLIVLLNKEADKTVLHLPQCEPISS